MRTQFRPGGNSCYHVAEDVWRLKCSRKQLNDCSGSRHSRELGDRSPGRRPGVWGKGRTEPRGDAGQTLASALQAPCKHLASCLQAGHFSLQASKNGMAGVWEKVRNGVKKLRPSTLIIILKRKEVEKGRFLSPASGGLPVAASGGLLEFYHGRCEPHALTLDRSSLFCSCRAQSHRAPEHSRPPSHPGGNVEYHLPLPESGWGGKVLDILPACS